MTLHLLSHPGRRHGLGLLGRASYWEAAILVAVFFAEILWRALHAVGSEVPAPEWEDGVLVAAVVLGSSWLYVRRHLDDLSPMKLSVVGALWALMSVSLDYSYRVIGGDRYVFHFLLSLLLGDYHGSNDWLLSLFLTTQLLGPVMMGAVYHAMSSRRTGRSG